MTRRRKVLIGIGAPLTVLLGYLFLWPVPIDPVAWNLDDDPGLSSGVYRSTHDLAALEPIELGGAGPEDVAIDAQGRIYGGLDDGRIMRAASVGAVPELFADTKGRPLGLAFDRVGNLIVADADKGLLSITPESAITVLATEEGGVPFVFTDDVDVAPNGLIYFSDASSKWNRHQLLEEFLEHRGHGRLLVYDPATKTTTKAMGGLYFANGVAVSKDGSFVLINETSKYRVQRLWLSGPRTGESEIFIENLPTMPDGISASDDGRFWLAGFAPRSPKLDFMLPRAWLRKVVYRLPKSLQPSPTRHGIVISLDGDGRVLGTLQDPSANSYSPITSAEAHGGWLYVGSLSHKGAARIALPAL